MKKKELSKETEETKPNRIGLTDRQKTAIPFFLGSKSYDEGCKQSGVSKTTFFEWLKNPIFKDELDKARDAIVEEAIGTLKSSTTKASRSLAELLDSSDNPTIIRGVANDIIGHVAKFKEMQEFEKRLADLEKSFEARKGL